MKLILENWKRFLKEQDAPQLKLYCDMDGVLVDFETGMLSHINQRFQKLATMQDELSQLKPDRKNPAYIEFKAARQASEELGGWDVEITATHITPDKGSDYKKVRNLMYRMVENDREIWATLPWMKDGKKLWNYIKDFDVAILSSPMKEGSKKGKEDWIARELGNVETYISSDKGSWGIRDGRQGLLIDDSKKYLDKFESGGGLTIAHVNADSTIKQLREKYGFVKNKMAEKYPDMTVIGGKNF